MSMHPLDWIIVAVLLAGLIFVITGTKRYMQGVADFLAAGRCGGRYLLCISEGIAGLGAITLVAFWEQYKQTGFNGIWWSLPNWPLLFILALSGWVLYRFRQTRALTLAQFLEMRYSRNFRIFTGFVAFISGIINYGVFPGINARLIIYFCGLPEQVHLGALTVSTMAIVMAILLSLALFFAFVGGQIAIMLSDFMQGIFCMVVMLATVLVLFYTVGWTRISEALITAPAGKSLINPFDMADIKGFSPRFFLIQYFIWFYCWKAWLGAQAYNSSATTPHESRMAGILGQWRYFAQEMIIPIFAVCALTILAHPDFVTQAREATVTLSSITNPMYESQMTVPVALRQVLPVGLMGLLTSVLLAAAISTDETYLHSWGSIFVQDIVMPIYRKSLSPKAHLWLLRLAILGVAVFAFCFSLYFKMADFVRLFFALTGAIYLGGAGAVIVGGLYTRWGTTAGAYAAMITSSVLATFNMISQQIAKAEFVTGGETSFFLRVQTSLYQYPAIKKIIHKVGYIDGQDTAFWTAIAAIIAYVLFSLLSGIARFNLDQMLHRGAYALEEDAARGDVYIARHWRWLGINHEFTRMDRVIYIGSVLWVFLWGGIFFVITGYHYWLKHVYGTDLTIQWWLGFWKIIVWMSIILGTLTTTWFLIGGLRDMRAMMHLLRTRVRDHTDDGTVRRSPESSE